MSAASDRKERAVECGRKLAELSYGPFRPDTIETLIARNAKLEAVYEAANGVAVNHGAARALAVKILIDVIIAVQLDLDRS